MSRRPRAASALVVLAIPVLLTACGGSSGPSGTSTSTGAGAGLRTVKIILDWTPNTNHTGLYAAVAKGFYAKHGLNVKIVQPGQSDPAALVAADKVPFGVGYQEALTEARAEGAPLVSLAAVIQHNTSGFASPADRGLTRPRDYAGHTYGSYGGAIEVPMLKSIMASDGGDSSRVKTVSVGDADFLTATKRGIDLAWIYYGWDGINAELHNQPLNIQYVRDYDKALDFYTPIIMTNEHEISSDPALVSAFVAATSEGYTWAAQHPADAAAVLLKAVPDLDAALVTRSQAWLSPRYQADAARWGEQKPAVWSNFATWLYQHKILKSAVDVSTAYTNTFLPKATK